MTWECMYVIFVQQFAGQLVSLAFLQPCVFVKSQQLRPYVLYLLLVLRLIRLQVPIDAALWLLLWRFLVR